ncbi:rhodanese-like domain-containing protein [Thiovibrio sp. JS02]
MKKNRLLKFVPLLVFAAFLVSGPVGNLNSAQAADPAPAATQAQNVFKGKVTGKSNKAKTITIEVKGNTEMVKFDDTTKGLEHAAEGEAAIIEFVVQGKDKVATVIKPKLAELPAGVTEIMPDEMAKLINQGQAESNYVLVDSRPAPRYHEGHVPTAISIPIEDMKTTGAARLPGDVKLKNTMLVFYCGGPT